MSEPHLLYQVKNNIASLTINREDRRNAISIETINLFLQHLDQAEADPDVRVILITGAGDKAFCAGADLGGDADGEIQAGFTSYAQLLKRLSGYPKPVVARVNGACMAGGIGFMLACDIVIAAQDKGLVVFEQVLGALKEPLHEIELVGELVAVHWIAVGQIDRRNADRAGIPGNDRLDIACLLICLISG